MTFRSWNGSNNFLKATPKDEVNVDDLLRDPEGTVFSGPHGEYYYGQTEDYTLNVVSPENEAIAVFDTNILIDTSSDEVSTLEVALANDGSVALESSVKVGYELPAIY